LRAYAQYIKRIAHKYASRKTHPPNRITRSKRPSKPSHPFARRVIIFKLGTREANQSITRCSIPDIPNASLNAELLVDRIPVIVIGQAPQSASILRALNKPYFGNIGWREAFRQLGWVMVQDSVVVVFLITQAIPRGCAFVERLLVMRI